MHTRINNRTNRRKVMTIEASNKAEARKLLNEADSLLRRAEKLVDPSGEAYEKIGYCITAVSDAESYITAPADQFNA